MKTNFIEKIKNVFLKPSSNHSFLNKNFIDTIPPNENEIITSELSGLDDLQKYLTQDFTMFGFNDGYKYHSKINRDLVLESIKSKFVFLLEKKIELKKIEKLKLEYDLIDIDGVSEALTKKAELKMERLVDLILDLEQQKKLTESSNGWISSIVANYKLGFEQGVFSYNETNDFLNLNSNI